jgi:methanogenic corrinoid protein MtbC1
VNGKTVLPADLGRIPRISQSGIGLFAASRVALTEVVDEKLALDRRGLAEQHACGPAGCSDDFQEHFGRLLASVYEFGLFAHLPEEFGWYVSTLSSRGFGEPYIVKMLDAWRIAILSRIRMPEAEELTRPLSLLEGHLDEFSKTEDGGPETGGLLTPTLSSERRGDREEEFLRLVLAKQRRAAVAFAREHSGPEPLAFVEGLISPVLKTIGILWQQGRITVADEHAATEICRHVILRAFDDARLEPRQAHTALVTCATGEEHELGAEVMADYLETKGWTAYFIGHSAPERDLLTTIENTKPEVVMLSVILVENLPGARDLAQSLRRNGSARVIIGGPAAVLAQPRLMDCCDAIVPTIEEGYRKACELVAGNA